MDLQQVIGTVTNFTKHNSSLISSVAAGVGVVATAYLTARASFKAARAIRLDEQYNETTYESPRAQLWGRTKLVWTLYIPPVLLGGSTIFAIAGANRLANKKILAAQSLVAVSQRALSEYRDKIVQEFSPRKDQSIVDKVVADKIAQNPPPATLISGPGAVLCCELLTMRYFVSDVETLRKAMNDLNADLLKHDYVTLEDWYWRIGLQNTTQAPHIGWSSDKLMELIFSAALTEDGRPCMAFDYNYIQPV
jgi:hypothetical protein